MITTRYLAAPVATTEQGALTITLQATVATEKAAGLKEEASTVNRETTETAFIEAQQESFPRRWSKTADLAR